MWGFLPPAVSDVFLATVLTRLVRGDLASLEDAVCAFLGSKASAAGSSWVKVLAALLEELRRVQVERCEVVLPAYSCNEFTKAALLAGLEPRYVDLRPDLASDPDAIAHAIGPRTLAVFSINNLGRASDNALIRSLCDERSVTCIEDATYTFLGRDDDRAQRFGSFGHFSVLNFSEGKIIPVGGGAVIANTDDASRVIAAVRSRIEQLPPASIAGELVRLLVYRAGSSRLGFTAYRLLRELTGTDLKKRLSMEPTRAEEVGNDLERTVGGRVIFRTGRDQNLREQPLRPLGSVRALCGAIIIERADEIRQVRLGRYRAYARALSSCPGVNLLPYPKDATCIKAPMLLTFAVSRSAEKALERLGVIRAYRNDYPTYGDPAFPNCNRFFDNVFTLPLHSALSEGLINEIARVVTDLAVSVSQSGESVFDNADDSASATSTAPA